ncbi:MAG: hypothetical protein JWN86_655 [Planctomycetota bacterium]|nr:hypothetical protein [Planctomycetota bacterium]
MATKTRTSLPEPMVLTDIPYDVYVALRDVFANRHKRMTYYDGTLEIMSPEYAHEKPSRRIACLVSVICEELNIEYEGTSSTTMRLPGDAPRKGKGKEPDQGFYFANAHRILGKASIKVAEGDPPPDLWIEVDNRGSSKGRLPVYSALGVPEVWQYRARSRRLRFLSLGEDGTYQPIDHSLSLPMLTPALVLEALALGRDVLEGTWTKRLRAWVRETLGPHLGLPR